MIKRIIITLAIVISTTLTAAGIQLTASVDKQALSLDQYLTYKVTITGDNLKGIPRIELPNFEKEFKVISSSKSNSFSIINGAMSSAINYEYQLVPLKSGTLRIKPATLKYKKNAYKTQSITVQINHSGQQTTQPSQVQSNPIKTNQKYGKIFVLASTPKKNYYVGEEIIYELKLYRTIRLFSDIRFDLPNFKGFLSENLQLKNSEYIEQVNQKKYYAKELLRKSLFAVNQGVYKISQSKVGVVINVFDGQTVLQSNPIQLKISPLPAKEKPKNFSGLVGEFELSTQATQTVVTQNAPLSLKITLKGSGNLKGVTGLTFDPIKECKIYQSSVIDEINQVNGIKGKRTFEYVIVPKKSGVVTIPSFYLAYFSPQKKKYQRIKTKQILVSVKPSGHPFNEEKIGKKDQIINKDIRYLKLEALDQSQKFFWQSITQWGVLFCLSIYALMMGLLLIKPYLKSKIEGVQIYKKGAYKEAIRQLEKLKKEQQSLTKMINKAQQIVLDFLSLKIKNNLLGLSNEKIKQILINQNIKKEMVDDILTLFNEMNFLAYAPQSEGEYDKVEVIEKYKKQVEIFKNV